MVMKDPVHPGELLRQTAHDLAQELAAGRPEIRRLHSE